MSVHFKLWKLTETNMWPVPICIILFSLGWHCMALSTEGETLISWGNALNTTLPFSWNPKSTTPCKWHGITCSTDGFITEVDLHSVQLFGNVPSQFGALRSLQALVLSSANLTGTIPREIGDYIHLSVLDLSDNRLTGGIPPEIGKLKNLETLVLSGNLLEGNIPPEIGSCSELLDLLIFDNNLRGSIPRELGRLSKLQVLRAGGNLDIDGELPPELGNCSELSVLGLAETNISGEIPPSYGNLKKLQVLAIYTSMISGAIPSELGNCTELQSMFLYANNLSGSLPKELGKLRKLEKLLLWKNSLVGTIPYEIGNCSALKVIDLSLNLISGSIPGSIGLLKNLTELQLSSNNISGALPGTLVNCTGLSQLQVDGNQISGEIPHEIGKLQNLVLFFAWGNRLQGNIPSSLGNCKALQSLDLTSNNLSGHIPPSIFNLKSLTKLLLLSNDLSGPVPSEIAHCKSLTRLRLGKNKLTGLIPPEVASLDNLNFLDMAENRFFGTIPNEIGKCTSLEMLDLHGNALGGKLPSSLGSLKHLHVLDVSMNRLSGFIPASLGNLGSLNKLTLSGNALSGEIPREISKCTKLQYLDLSNNKFNGSIPREIASLEGLDIALNVSWNHLSGPIPEEFSRFTKLSVMDLSHNMLSGNLSVLGPLENLASLNVSFNNFSGNLPDTSIFRALPAVSITGNPALCDSEDCFDTMSSQVHSKNPSIKVIIIILFSITAGMLLLGVCMLAKTKKLRRGDLEDPDTGWPWQMIPFQKFNFTVNNVLDSLVDNNIIGKGCSGVVYRAEMPDGDVIAVKKLWTSKSEDGILTRDSFAAEVRTLGSIRHKNIVRLLGYCNNSSTKLLMYDYMPNGSLGSFLHEEERGMMLDWEQRYNIILGAAQGLEYLHHHCVPAIVHRDVKANNILLGSRFEPYLGDFGLAKLVDSADALNRTSPNVAGSYGYIAPEYGYKLKITEKSDVYSYGVVLLEVLTGKPPISAREERSHLVEWVKQTLRKRDSIEVLDPMLQGRPDQQIQEMLQALGVALLCVNPIPEERPTMKDVAALLKEIRAQQPCDGLYESCENAKPESCSLLFKKFSSLDVEKENNDSSGARNSN